MSKSAYDYNLTNPETMENPYDFYAAIHRDNARLVEVPGVGYWVGRMDDIKELAKNTQVFSNSYFDEGGPVPTGVSGEPLEDDVKEIFNKGPEVVNALWTADPPIHTTHRKLVNKAFTASWVKSMEPVIEEIADELISNFINNGKADFMQQYAVYLPMIVIAEALGMDRKDAELFKVWSDDILTGNLDVLDHKGRLRVAQSFIDANNHFKGILEERRINPKSDLISALANASVNGRSLMNKEALPIIDTLMLAGNETTTNLIGNALRILVEDDIIREALEADKSMITPFLDEVMRFDGPVQCLYRIVTKDTEFAGQKILKGTKIMLGWGSAGHDPDHFDNPQDFVLGRSNAYKHIGFGFGAHLCVGLGLARTEARIAVNVFLNRLKNVRFSDDIDLTHVPTFATRGYKTLNFDFNSR